MFTILLQLSDYIWHWGAAIFSTYALEHWAGNVAVLDAQQADKAQHSQ